MGGVGIVFRSVHDPMKAMKYVLAFDQGTTSSRSIIFDERAQIVSLSQNEIKQIYPRPGWVEHDPHEIHLSQVSTAIDAMRAAGLSAGDISAIGITNQRETTIVWDRKTGVPIHNAIVWQDRRTAEFCDRIRERHSETVRRKTGLEVDAYFSASKIGWLMDNVPDARRRAENGELAFGTVDSWIIWHLTNGKLHVTDVSNASRTMLFNIESSTWDAELLEIYGVPHIMLPDVRASSDIYGETDMVNDLKGVKITGIAGDQQAALFGQACFEPGSAKCTYGTGCFLLENTGREPLVSKNRLLTTVGWKIDGKTDYALEGSVFIGGAVVQWLRDELGIIKSSGDVERFAGSVADNTGVFFVPAFAGLGTPHWDQDARGTIIGLTRGTGGAHIARAALESIAFQTLDLIAALNSDSSSGLNELKVDGGASRNDMLMQFQADLLQIPVVRSKISETTALGAAYLAGLAADVWTSQDELASHWQSDLVFEPKMNESQAKSLIERWHEAVHRALGWAKI
jgi:glycerol kinase